MRNVLVCIGLAVAGCAAFEMSLPVNGRLNGQFASGYTTARSDGRGSFLVQATGGVRCEGAYDARNAEPTITIPVTCVDGRAGEVVVNRSPDGQYGTAAITFNDGSRGQFVYGHHMRYEDGFPGPDATAPRASKQSKR